MASVRVDLRLIWVTPDAYPSAYVPGSGRRDALLTATNTLFTGGVITCCTLHLTLSRRSAPREQRCEYLGTLTQEK